MLKKKIQPTPNPPALNYPFRKFLISILKKILNENYVELYFRMGTVLVIFFIFLNG